MVAAANNPYPSILTVEGTTPSTPAAGQQRLFVRSSDHVLCYVNSSGTVSAVATGLTNPLTTTGDIIYSSSGTTAARLGIGSSAQVLTVAGGLPSWAAAASGAATGSMNQLAADVTMTSTDTYYDGPSLSLVAGTYIMMGTVSVNGNDASTLITGKLWNGTTVLASAEQLIYGGAAGRKYACLTLVGYKVLSGTETWKISVAGNGSPGTLLKAAANNGAGDNASTLVALKIA